MENKKCRISNFEYGTPTIKHRTSNTESRRSNIEYRTSNIKMPNIECRISNIECRMPNTRYRTSKSHAVTGPRRSGGRDASQAHQRSIQPGGCLLDPRQRGGDGGMAPIGGVYVVCSGVRLWGSLSLFWWWVSCPLSK